MTTKLKWRLGKLPTSNEVLELVKSSLITKEEAKEILFTQETEEDVDVEALKSEIKFLRTLVDKLSSRTQIIETIREVHKPYYKYDWYRPYEYWSSDNNGIYLCNSGGTNAGNTLAIGDASIQVAAYATDSQFTNNSAGFTDIRTF